MSELNELNELNKEFLCGDPLMAQDLNDIINLANGIIRYINGHKEGWSSDNGGGTTLNYPLNDINSAGLSTVPGEDYAIVSSSNGWKWKLVTTGNNQLGLNGLDGISTLLAFFGAVDDSAALSAVNAIKDTLSYPPSANFSTTSNITLQQGLMLYMTSAKRRGDSLYISENDRIWLVPVRIGSGSTTSTTGTDDDNYNYIYCRTKEYITPGNLDGTVNTSNYGILILTAIENDTGRVNGFKYTNGNCLTVLNIDSADINDIDGAWTDHPRGISPESPYEWLVGFKKGSNDNWEYYFGPICISHWGHNGLDGDGYEYIYYLLPENQSGAPSLTAPYNGSVTINGTTTNYTGVAVNNPNYLQDDFIPTGWHDEPLSVSSAYPRQYCSTRRKDGALEAGDQWQAFTEPKLWSIYASSGSSMTIDNDTIILDDDTGSDAIEYVSLTQVHLWDGLDEITFAHNTYGKITVTMTCTGSFATSLKACIVTGIDNNGDVTSSVIGGDSGTGWNIEYEILSNSYNDPNVNFLGFCLRKADINNAKLNPEVGTITYTIKAYTNVSDATPAKTASRLLSIQIIDISNGEVYRLNVTPNTLGVSRSTSSSAYTYRDGVNTVTISANVASGLSVEKATLNTYANNLAEGSLYILVKKTYLNNGLISTDTASATITQASNNKDLEVTFNPSTEVPVTVIHDYNVELWYKRDTGGDIKLDNETIDFSIQGDLGPAAQAGDAGYVIHVDNDNAIFDDLTVGDTSLDHATRNVITIEKGTTDVTSECTFTVTEINLPNQLNIESTGTPSNTSSWVLRSQNVDVSGANVFRLAHFLKGIQNDLTLRTKITPGSYYYIVTITHNNVLNRQVKLGVYVDADISGDGSFYKLALIDDYVKLNAEGTSFTEGYVKAVVRKITTLPTEGVEVILPTQITVQSSIPTSGTGLYLVTDIPFSPSDDNSGNNNSKTNEPCKIFDFTQYNGTINYVDRYSVTLYKGTQLLDGPEHIECTKALSSSPSLPGQPGPQGPGGINITINPNPTAVSFGVDSSTNLWTGNTTIFCTATKTINGGTTTTIDGSSGATIDGCSLYYKYTYIDTSDNLLKSSLYYKYSTAGITVYAEASSLGDFAGKLVTQINFYLSEDTLSTVSTLTNPLSVTASVPILRSGKKGEAGLNSTGQVGKFYYYAGDWDTEVTNLEATSTKYPYVKYNGNFYMYKGNERSDSAKNNFLSNGSSDPSNDSTNWEIIQYNKYLISDAIFSKYAELGSVIINKDWMISQYGTINGVFSTSYLLFDPIALTTHYRSNVDEGAAIGVITRSSGTNSQMFRLNGHAQISVMWSGETKLVRVNDSVAYRSSNSGELTSTLYRVITTLNGTPGNRTGSNAINTDYWNNPSGLSEKGSDIFGGTGVDPVDIVGNYCFIGGNVSYIRVKYNLDILSSLSPFIPEFAIDLRGGFIYANNAYIRGDVSATSFRVMKDAINPSIVFTTATANQLNENHADYLSGLKSAGFVAGLPVAFVWKANNNTSTPDYFFDFAPVSENLTLTETLLYNITGANTTSGQVYIARSDLELYYVNSGPTNINHKYISRPRSNSPLANINNSSVADENNFYIREGIYSAFTLGPLLSLDDVRLLEVTVFRKIIIIDGQIDTTNSRFGYVVPSHTLGTAMTYIPESGTRTIDTSKITNFIGDWGSATLLNNKILLLSSTNSLNNSLINTCTTGILVRSTDMSQLLATLSDTIVNTEIIPPLSQS